MERILRTNTVSTLMAQAVSAAEAGAAVQQAEFLLASRLGTTDGFTITSQDEMLETMGEVALHSNSCWERSVGFPSWWGESA